MTRLNTDQELGESGGRRHGCLRLPPLGGPAAYLGHSIQVPALRPPTANPRSGPFQPGPREQPESTMIISLFDTTTPEVAETDWRTSAACAGHPTPDWFFPTPSQRRRTKAALAVCAACPVTDSCLLDALEGDERDGIRAGLTEERRLAHHRQYIPKADRLDFARILAASMGDEVRLSQSEGWLLGVYAVTQPIRWTVIASAMRLSEKAAKRRLTNARKALSDPKIAPQRQRELADLIAYRDRDERRQPWTEMAA